MGKGWQLSLLSNSLLSLQLYLLLHREFTGKFLAPRAAPREGGRRRLEPQLKQPRGAQMLRKSSCSAGQGPLAPEDGRNGFWSLWTERQGVKNVEGHRSGWCILVSIWATKQVPSRVLKEATKGKGLQKPHRVDVARRKLSMSKYSGHYVKKGLNKFCKWMHSEMVQWNCISANKTDKANQFFNLNLVKIWTYGRTQG